MKQKIIYALVLFLSIPGFSYAQACGDANGDVKIDILDALKVVQCYVGGICNLPETVDVDCSGTVDVVDALMIAQYYVGLRTSLACCPATIWVGVSAGMQCLPLEYPTLEGATSELQINGIQVYGALMKNIITCAACEICPDMRVWLAKISSADKDKALALGWHVETVE